MMRFNPQKEAKELEKFYKKFGKRVRKLRLECELSQQDMTQFGFSKRHIQKIEAGKNITLAILVRLSKVFKVSISDLMTGL